MTDGFTQMIDDSNAFFAELKQNNTKDWFNPRKEQYNNNIKKPAELFAQILGEDFSQISGINHKPKVFRIYRDVRFSKDKTPLNAHLHMMWSTGDVPFTPVFYFGSEPGSMVVGTGVVGLKGADLAKFRAMIDVDGDALVEAIASAGMETGHWGPPALKRVPAPYDQHHPHAELLRRKGLSIHCDVEDEWRDHKGGLTGAVKDHFRKAQAFRDVLAENLS